MKTVRHIQKPVSEKETRFDVFSDLHSQHEAHTAHNIKKVNCKKFSGISLNILNTLNYTPSLFPHTNYF